MINYLYVDNLRGFTDFEYRPSSLDLLIGDNGTGKTTVFDILATLRDFVVSGVASETLFPASERTAWRDDSVQRFRLGIASNGRQYYYTLEIEHDEKRIRSRIASEELLCDDRLLFLFDGTDAHLFRDDSSTGPKFPFDWSRSALGTIPERGDNQRLIEFRQSLSSLYVFSLDPARISSISRGEDEWPDRYLSSFASWLRHVLQESPELFDSFNRDLRETIDGFQSFKLERAGENSRELRLAFAYNVNTKKPFTLSFTDLSFGQRSLFVLYAILHYGVGKGATVCFDEPDNFLSLREIQPWTIALRDKVLDSQGQCLLISHHPEMMDYLAIEHGKRFYRDKTGASRVGDLNCTDGDPLRPSELFSRGWE